MSKWMAKMATGARVIDTPRNATESWLLNTVHRHADAAGIRHPEVAIYDSPDVNAFATGPTRNNALVAVSTRAASQLIRARGRGRARPRGHARRERRHGDAHVAARRREHVRHVPVARRRFLRRPRDVPHRARHGPGFFFASFVAQILLGILATMIVMWFSRQREFRADAGGAKLAGRDSMIRALEACSASRQPAQSAESDRARSRISGGRVASVGSSCRIRRSRSASPRCSGHVDDQAVSRGARRLEPRRAGLETATRFIAIFRALVLESRR